MTTSPKIKGLMGTKLGMTQVWDENNNLIPVTVVQAEPNVVTQLRNEENDGYGAVQIAYGAIDPRKVSKPLVGHFDKAGVTPRRHLVEIRTSDVADYELGQDLTVEQFEAGQLIDVTANSKGKGFAGAMKRHNFGGAGASHVQKPHHRQPGSVCGGASPGRVFQRKKLPVRMGNVKTTTQTLTLHGIAAENNLLLIKGAVPGPRGRVVLVRDAVKGA